MIYLFYLLASQGQQLQLIYAINSKGYNRYALTYTLATIELTAIREQRVSDVRIVIEFDRQFIPSYFSCFILFVWFDCYLLTLSHQSTTT